MEKPWYNCLLYSDILCFSKTKIIFSVVDNINLVPTLSLCVSRAQDELYFGDEMFAAFTTRLYKDGTTWNCLDESVLLRFHNTQFCG